MSQIIVAREKHYTRYLDASTDEALAKSALKVLTERFNDGYWYHDPKDWADSIVEVLGDEWPGWGVPEDERVAAINAHYNAIKEKYGDDPEVLDLKTKKVKAAIRDYKEAREMRKWYDEMKELVESQDWEAVVTFKSGRTEPKSWYLLSQRSDAEYESVELEELETNG